MVRRELVRQEKKGSFRMSICPASNILQIQYGGEAVDPDTLYKMAHIAFWVEQENNLTFDMDGGNASSLESQ